MKSFRNILSVVLTVILVCMLSTVVFAETNVTPQLDYSVKTISLPEITKGSTDSFEVGVAIYAKDGTPIEIEGNDKSMIWMGFAMPDGVTCEQVTVPENIGIAKTAVNNKDEGYINFEINVKNTVLLTETTPVIKLTLTPSANLEEGTYSFAYDSSEDVGDVIRMLSYKTSVGSTVGATKLPSMDIPAFKVVAKTPVVNKCNVTFKGHADLNKTDVVEGTNIKLPSLSVGKNEEFAGWSDGKNTYTAGTEYEVKGNVEFEAVINTITIPQPKADENIISVEIDGKTYTDIFEGIYTVTPGKATINNFGVKATKVDTNEERTFTKPNLGEITGNSEFKFRLAVVGVTAKSEISTVPFAAYIAD